MKSFITNYLCLLFIVLIHFTYKCYSILPEVSQHHMTGKYYHIDANLIYDHPYSKCYILMNALKRFNERLTLIKQYPKIPMHISNTTIHKMKIFITNECNETNNELWPSEFMNETYSILIFSEKIILQAEEIWGILHGLETILQLIYRSPLETNIIEGGLISDEPLFSHRGFLIDTSRHYLSIKEIEKFIDAMSMVKMNVLHWHIVDDQSFPYVSEKFPKLSIKLYKELFSVFRDNWFHLGGDEVDYGCWRSNPLVIEFMKQMKFGDDYRHLEGYYINRLIQIINDIKPPARNITPVVWQEIFQNGFRGDKSTVIHVWKSSDWKSVMKNITQSGYRVLFSAAWYLNLISYGNDWKNYYQVDPRDFGGSKEDEQLVIGGEATMWGEYVDDTNLFSRSWPRGSAVAERLWSKNSPNVADFTLRVEELRCRMLSRGWNAEPINGPGFCPV
ncbi:unnamed protein product [Schistosoma turkestanicum]|nr:unnamed protein product [Schistosoma turkestanicum]